MSITELSIKRSTAIVMFVVLIVGLGIFGYSKMGADLLPSINVPVITISTTYPGASAEEVKKDVVRPIEDAVAGISGIESLNSTARESFGQTIVQFKMETDMNTAFIDIQKAVDSSLSKLPKDADKPVLYKVDLNQQAVLALALSGDVPYDELYATADKVKTDMEKVEGIGNVIITGAQEKQLSINIDKLAMEYYKIDINTIINILKMQNINMPAGEIEQKNNLKSLKVVGEFKDINDIKNLLLPISNGANIRLSDIADVKLAYPDQKTIFKLNGKSTIALSIQKKSDANVVKAVDAAKKEIESYQKKLPSGVKLQVAFDTTTFIRSSLNEVQRSLIEGIITTAFVLFLFLRKWRSSIIVLISIPTSLIASFFFMYIMGFTLNMMSLMGLSLCVGILVDDSIVILENIQKHLAMGKSPIKAAIDGRKEIGMAAIAITLCDIVVYVPVAFVSGMSGQFLRQFGLTVAVAAFFSLIMSFTLTPMLAAKWLEKEKPSENSNKKTKTQGFMQRANDAYKNFLIWSLSHRKRVIAFVMLSIFLSILLIPFGFIKFDFMAKTDQSIFTVSLNLSPGSTINQTDEKAKLVENHLKEIKEVTEYYTFIGNNNDTTTANLTVKLMSKNKRKKSQFKIQDELRQWGKQNLSGVQMTISEISSMTGNQKPIVVNVMGNDTKVLKEISQVVETEMKTVSGIVDISNSSKAGQSEFRLQIDRLASFEYGISPLNVASAVRSAVLGTKAGVFRQNGNDYDIYVKFADGQIKTTYDLGSITVANSQGKLLSLDQIATVENMDTPSIISRKDRQDVVAISAGMSGKSLGEINKELNSKIKKITLPSGYSVEYGGSQKSMQDSFVAMGGALLASLVFVYMILVVLYNSYLTPLIRMLALPCAIVGALGIMAITGKPIDVMGMIGLIMLDGLASKNGTLLIDYTQTLQNRGLELKDALIEAGTTRLRPIIMTTVTMVVGMMPAALAIGDGSENKSGMALIVIGGLISSTVLTPILLPVVYTLIDDLIKKFRKKSKKSFGGNNNEQIKIETI